MKYFRIEYDLRRGRKFALYFYIELGEKLPSQITGVIAFGGL